MSRSSGREGSHRPKESWGQGWRADEDYSLAGRTRPRREKASEIRRASLAYLRRTRTWQGPLTLFYDATELLNRCLARERSPLAWLSIGAELYYRTEIHANPLTRNNLDALAVDGHGENFATSFANGVLHALAGVRFDQKDDAAAAAGSADFAGQSAITARVVNHTIDRLCGDGRQVALAERPLLAHQAARFGPIRFFKSQAHLLGDFGNPLQAVLNGAIAADLCLEDFP